MGRSSYWVAVVFQWYTQWYLPNILQWQVHRIGSTEYCNYWFTTWVVTLSSWALQHSWEYICIYIKTVVSNGICFPILGVSSVYLNFHVSSCQSLPGEVGWYNKMGLGYLGSPQLSTSDRCWSDKKNIKSLTSQLISPRASIRQQILWCVL